MALSTTTLSSACAATDRQIVVASATSFAAGDRVLIDQELFYVSQAYVAGNTTIPVLRGQGGTVVAAHPATANVVRGAGSDFANPAVQAEVTYPIFGRSRIVQSYSASGAITLPNAGSDLVVVLNGTSALAMTIVAPTNDLDGCIVYVVANGKAAHTLAPAGNNGIGNGGSGYRTLTFASGAQNAVSMMAVNGNWVPIAPAWGGTATNITVTLS